MKPITIDLDIVRAGSMFQTLYYDRWFSDQGHLYIIGQRVPDERVRGLHSQIWSASQSEREWMIPDLLEKAPGGIYAQIVHGFASDADLDIAERYRKRKDFLRIWFHENNKNEAMLFKLTHGGRFNV